MLDVTRGLQAGMLAGQQINEAQRQSEEYQRQQLELRKKAGFDDARKVRIMMEAGDIPSALSVMKSRAENVTRLGGDNSDTLGIIDMVESGDVAGALSKLRVGEQVGVSLGYLQSTEPDELQQLKIAQARQALEKGELDLGRLRSGESVQQKTANIRDYEKFQALLESDPEKAMQFGRKAGFIGETEQEKADISVDEATRKAVAKANTARRQGFINSGIEAADGAANMNRALSLLDSIDTGGFDNVALKAKQIFGVEGADEGELSSLMGKAVLAQLKPIFGAAFTAAEGERLEALEARFGRSPETNKRLIENALKIIDRAARRGVAAAEDQGDYFTADEIKNSLALNLEDKLEGNLDKPVNTSVQRQSAQGQLSDEFAGFRVVR